MAGSILSTISGSGSFLPIGACLMSCPTKSRLLMKYEETYPYEVLFIGQFILSLAGIEVNTL
jgi:hypothetical protein